MKNPYEVLGIPQGSSMDRVNEAYRQKAREYGQSNNMDKLNELNEAYDTIAMNGSYSSSGSYSSTGTYYANTDYSDIRAKINNRDLDNAQLLLDGIPEGARDAEWYYLMGTVYQKRGWIEEAVNHLGRACSLDPSNSEYQKAYDKVSRSRNGGYRADRSSGGNDSCDFCSICTGLLCADSCCECMGGDLIPCC